jgi:heme oxygenase (biliverdin-IX-beta and delta-forming)
MDLEQLRRETLADHKAVEQNVPLMDQKFGADASGVARPTVPEMTSAADLLGAMYVMEGSTLGGQLIARHVELVLGLTAGQGNAHFRGHNERTG